MSLADQQRAQPICQHCARLYAENADLKEQLEGAKILDGNLVQQNADLKRRLEKAEAELAELESFLHSRCQHPDYEYETTDGPRKAFDEHAPNGEGWERNTDAGRDGWERFDYHEEAYWRRSKPASGEKGGEEK